MNGFTKLDNAILFDNTLSAQAKILYTQFYYYSTIPNFVIRKTTIMKASGMKKNTFEKYLRELKEHGLITLKETRIGNKYEYEYIVNDPPVNKEEPQQNTTTKATSLVSKVINDLKHVKKKKQEDIHVTPSTNRFNNFPQRNYTKQDYDNLEQMLLKKSYICPG